MTDIKFEQGDQDALPFIDNETIIKHLEQQGYQVIDKSEHGDVIEKIKSLEKELEELEDEAQTMANEINGFM